jgi:hypothetical protein
MMIINVKLEHVLEKGLVKQVVLADSDGFVLDNWGYSYDPDELIAIFMSTQRQMEDGVLRFDFGQISEFGFSLVGHDSTIACRRVFWPTGGCIVVVVVPVGAAYEAIVAEVISCYARSIDNPVTVLRKA